MTVVLARRTWAGLFAMIALIVSLVGMHSLAMPMPTAMPISAHLPTTAATTMPAAMPISAHLPTMAVTSVSAATLVNATALMGMSVRAATEVQLAVSQASESLRGLGDTLMAMSCAMALLTLALVLLMGRSRVIVTALASLADSAGAVWPRTMRLARPPSLMEMSISRT